MYTQCIVHLASRRHCLCTVIYFISLHSHITEDMSRDVIVSSIGELYIWYHCVVNLILSHSISDPVFSLPGIIEWHEWYHCDMYHWITCMISLWHEINLISLSNLHCPVIAWRQYCVIWYHVMIPSYRTSLCSLSDITASGLSYILYSSPDIIA